jgi:alkanesulfonate monooxygenase SsuD/methylene tetrahydromethanopterin reductase-like flavin-dependent oxidoreductase (luciferase family)
MTAVPSDARAAQHAVTDAAPAPRLRIGIRYDMRSPDFATPMARMYQAALEQCSWADGRGFDHVQLSEHHGCEDGYCPSPLLLAAGIAGCTRHLRLLLAAIILPLHDPVRVAEDVAVLDLVSGGRAEVGCVPGYRATEFAMFGHRYRDRYALFDDALRVLRQAWTGEPFERHGTRVRVTPQPLQRPHPPLYVGGRSVAAARRAAALADGMLPASADPRLHEVFAAERRRLGLSPGRWYQPGPANAVVVTEDPERTWAQLGPHALHDATVYAGWAADAGLPSAPVPNLAALVGGPLYQVVTPEECVRLAASLDPRQRLVLHPLLAGVDPQLGWTSLELFVSRVLPQLAPPEPIDSAPANI